MQPWPRREGNTTDHTNSDRTVAAFLPGVALRGGTRAGTARGGAQEQRRCPMGLARRSFRRAVNLPPLTTNGGYTRQDWADLFRTMVALPAGDESIVADYLAASFPSAAAEACRHSRHARVSIREWVVPTLGSRPHDPERARRVDLVDRHVCECDRHQLARAHSRSS
jgi:hypothetical protein